ncbi:MAG: efflux RND transporter periplasmic adaptor subunit [Armatimonadetes bacterium]|nr:efflux RND transporter periplasmic adaptor subunit [Armatimonadota bacterium]
MNRRILASALVLLALMVLAVIVWPRHAPPPQAEKNHQDEHGDHGDEQGDHGGAVTLSAEQVRRAGIVVKPLAARTIRQALEVRGVVRPDPNRTAKVVSRAAGRIVRLRSGEGDRVGEGALMVVIDSPEVGDRRVAVRDAAAHVEVARRRLARQRRLASESIQSSGPPLEARLRRDRARVEAERTRRAWERAQRSYPDLMSRRDYEAARADYQNASAELETAEALYARERQMAARATRQRVDTSEAENDLDAAQAELASARDSLLALGVGDGGGGEFAVHAPLSGTITTCPVSAGQWVSAGEALFTIVDISTVWAVLDIYEKDMPRVRVGQEVEVRSPAVPDRVFGGRVSYISPLLEDRARTAHARVALHNSGDALRAEMFVNARVLLSARGQAVSVPSSAVVTDGSRTHVYVETEPGKFSLRPVALGLADGDWRPVRSGLRPGERVVVAGAFTLKSEQHKGEMGDEHGH